MTSSKSQPSAAVSRQKEELHSALVASLASVAGQHSLPPELLDSAVRIALAAEKRQSVSKKVSVPVRAKIYVYAASRVGGHPLTLDEVSERDAELRTTIGRSYIRLLRRLDLKPKFQNLNDHVSKLSERMKLDDEVKKRALAIAEDLKKNKETHGRSPEVLARISIFLALNAFSPKRTRSEQLERVCAAAGVTSASTRQLVRPIESRVSPELLLR